MLQKVLFILIVLVIFLSGYFYFIDPGNTETENSPLPQNPSKYIWMDSNEELELIQFNRDYSQGERMLIKTNFGNIKIVLYPEKAPKACENFISLAKQGFYSGLKFDQPKENYFIKSGDPKDGTGGRSIWDKPFPNEYSIDLWNFRGAIGMVSSEKNKNGSQFYIICNNDINEKMISDMEKAEFPQKVIDKYKEVGGAPWIDGKHTVFGHVVSGMDIVDRISNNSSDEPAVIEEIIME